MAIKIISEKEARKSTEICKSCKHTKSYHIFWNHDKRVLELTNCNECNCVEYKNATK